MPGTGASTARAANCQWCGRASSRRLSLSAGSSSGGGRRRQLPALEHLARQLQLLRRLWLPAACPPLQLLKLGCQHCTSTCRQWTLQLQQWRHAWQPPPRPCRRPRHRSTCWQSCSNALRRCRHWPTAGGVWLASNEARRVGNSIRLPGGPCSGCKAAPAVATTCRHMSSASSLLESLAACQLCAEGLLACCDPLAARRVSFGLTLLSSTSFGLRRAVAVLTPAAGETQLPPDRAFGEGHRGHAWLKAPPRPQHLAPLLARVTSGARQAPPTRIMHRK